MQEEWHNPTLEELATLLWLNSIPRIGPAASKLLLAHYRTPLEVFGASNYQEVLGLRSHMVEELQRAPKVLTSFLCEAEQILSQVEQFGISIVTPLVPAYPQQLLEHPSYAPSILYVMGDATCLALEGGALVGTRAPSAEARERAHQAAATLARSGQAIFSGMAKGIDAEGHRGALEAGGKTVAVLGCGVNRIYPAEHADLYERIRHTGAIVSEYMPNTPPSPENLRRRNKLIVGLSRFVVVAECPSDSGAIIAARAALQQQRPLFVLKLDLPGFEKERSGTHLLSSTGLAAVWDGRDISWLEHYASTYMRPPSAEARLDEMLGKKRQASPKKGSTTAKDAEASLTAPPKHVQVEEADPLLIKPALSTRSKNPSRRAPQQSLSSPQQVPFTKNQLVRHPKFGNGVIKRINYEDPGFIEVTFENKATKKFGFAYVHLLEAI